MVGLKNKIQLSKFQDLIGFIKRFVSSGMAQCIECQPAN